MAMTDEELLLQMNILATKTDSATNPNMPFKTNATLNKGLNPEFFSGQYTKIVNAINQLATGNANTSTLATDVANKVNEVLLDVSSTSGATVWENVKVLSKENTVIQIIEKIVSGNMQQQILNLKADDIGKFLMVSENEDGDLITTSAEIADLITTLQAADIVYDNPERPEFSNVQSALDYILNNEGSFGGGSNTPAGPIDWVDIQNKPALATGMSIKESQLCLTSEDDTLSSIDLVTDEDIDTIFEAL
jgi:hypothetical protein